MARPKDQGLRERVLAAAAREFAAKGFAGASLAAIGAAAGVTKGGVYFCFPSKEAVFFAVLDAWTGGLRASMQQAVPEQRGADALRGFVARFLGHHFQSPDAARLLRVLATEMRGRFTTELREDWGQALRGLRARVRDLLGSGIRDGSLFASDPAQAAFLVVAAVEGVVQQWLAAPRDVEAFCDPQALAEAIVKAWELPPAGRRRRPALPPSAGSDLVPPF